MEKEEAHEFFQLIDGIINMWNLTAFELIVLHELIFGPLKAGSL